VNFVGHHEVAARLGLPADARLGAMLPDLATMLGVRLQRELLAPSVAEGVAVHHATDAVFHDDARVRRAMVSLGAALSDAGLARGPARAIGHVGYEMLLDATATAPIADALDESRATAVTDALHDHPEWSVMRSYLATRRAHYDDVEWVAERLFHILDRRPRLRFPHAQISDVAAALATAQPSVRAHAPAIFADVTAAVTRP
jgi:hypothetical protein